MRLQSTLAYLFLAFSPVAFYGCTTGIIAQQTWSENYALMEGVQANDPAVVDGDVKTVGQSQYVEVSSDAVQTSTLPRIGDTPSRPEIHPSCCGAFL